MQAPLPGADVVLAAIVLAAIAVLVPYALFKLLRCPELRSPPPGRLNEDEPARFIDTTQLLPTLEDLRRRGYASRVPPSARIQCRRRRAVVLARRALSRRPYFQPPPSAPDQVPEPCPPPVS